VFLCYASQEGAAFIDRALYLPREWTDDPRRLSEAGVPKGVGFATKGELAKVMLGRAFEAGVPARWIVADTVYGMTRGLRGWLEKRERSYVLAVTSSKGIYYEGRHRQVRKVAKSLSEQSWMRASAGSGRKALRLGLPGATPERSIRRRGVAGGTLVADASEHRRARADRLLPLLRASTDECPRIDPDRGQALGHRG
jgi:SRSO17 transposase